MTKACHGSLQVSQSSPLPSYKGYYLPSVLIFFSRTNPGAFWLVSQPEPWHKVSLPTLLHTPVT